MQFLNFTAEKKNRCRFYITWALCSDMIKVYEVIYAVAHLDGPFIIIIAQLIRTFRYKSNPACSCDQRRVKNDQEHHVNKRGILYK